MRERDPTMKTTSLPRKFLSRREKNGHRRGRSSDPAHKHRPLSSEAFFSLFKPESARQSTSADSEQEKEAIQIDDVRRRIADRDFPALSDDQIRYVLSSKYSSGDVGKAIELLVLQQKSLAGKILSYNPGVRMLGAENRGNVTCYLDALLFAMFAKLESFECMLTNDSMEEPQRKLAALLRLWVNMLRSGKLIETDMTEHIQDALAACGWRDAQLLEQQDTSEAFAFITETLQLPLLTLQVDLFHQGQNDDADHKVVYERLLNLAVPPDNDGKGIRLEDCLEEYFNSQVDVLRDSLDEKKTAERSDSATATQSPNPSNEFKSTIRVVTEEDQQECSTPETESGPSLERRWTVVPDFRSPDPQIDSDAEASGSQSILRPHRSRTESIIQRVVLDEQGNPSESDAASLFQRAKKTASVVRAVTIPAWQFFRLIPWHSPANKEPESDLEVARHFNQRPVVGICLKRYMMDEKGNMKRQNTYIDIPDSLRLPHFIVDERHVEESGLASDYKLVLQSVVCHRGDSLHSGHYVSFCRVAPKLLTDNRRHDNDPPPDYEEAQWVKFDDLAVGDRVTLVDDIKQSLKEEMPYLLFYQIVPIVEVASSAEDTDVEPPAYDDTALNLTSSETSAAHSQDRLSVSRQPSSYFDSLSVQPSVNGSTIRFSAELERPRRSFADEDGFLSVSRRGSIYNDSSVPSPAITPEAPSPAVTPGEETTAQRLSRAAARFRGGNKSRSQSQAGENRKSLTVTRFGGFMKSSKEPLRDTTSTETEEDYEFIEDVNKNGAKGNDQDATPTQKRGKSKIPFDKGKVKDKKINMPDRECIVYPSLRLGT
ncbi:cysteine proteinase [Hypoxylon trugodes]|uniref:cysteine proteinase n=1 Tax=Hypoxylon trugodes TaxID=326681 RepID=UPI00219E10CD|nr:cysteine proteinase [Hypoxylon trugodes]KAI1391227.1 cysteine proteinase [Hypoxylon trugodes]